MKNPVLTAITFRSLGAQDDAAWDALVASSPQGNAFLSKKVLSLLAANEHPIAEIIRVGAVQEDGSLAAGWAVLLRKRGIFSYCSSFPLFYAGPLLAPEWNEPVALSNRTLLLERLARCLQEHFDFINTEAAPELPDARGLIYAGYFVEQTYTHLWPAGEADAIVSRLNRSKRREMKAAQKKHGFQWLPMSEDSLRRFDQLHNKSLEKFRWVAPHWWRRSLLKNMKELESEGICRMAVASVQGETLFCAGVSVLLSSAQNTAWLWRVAYQTNDPGLIPALYVWVAMQIKMEFGSQMRINFGGSPRSSLALFKDFLGAEMTPHWIISWQRPGWKPLFWNMASLTKELVRQRMTLAGWR